MEIPIIVLAAGTSSRLGRPKQLLPWHNKTLIEHTVQLALFSEIGQVYVITGAHNAQIEEKITDFPVTCVFNPHYAAGMSTSIIAGLKKVLSDMPGLEAVILCLCDQPYLTSDILCQLVSTYKSTKQPLVHCSYTKLLTGPPSLIDKIYFPKLLALSGDAGGKKLFLQYPDDVAVVDFPRGVTDIDTWLDYKALE